MQLFYDGIIKGVLKNLSSLVKQTVDVEKQQIPAKLELIKLQDTFLKKKEREVEAKQEKIAELMLNERNTLKEFK